MQKFLPLTHFSLDMGIFVQVPLMTFGAVGTGHGPGGPGGPASQKTCLPVDRGLLGDWGCLMEMWCGFCGGHVEAVQEGVEYTCSFCGHELKSGEIDINVVVNQWTGNGPKYPFCYCWACYKPATVAEIADADGALLVRLCGTCLNKAQQAIGKAILESVRHEANSRNSNPAFDGHSGVCR